MATATKARKAKTRKGAGHRGGNGKTDPVNLARAPRRLEALNVGIKLIDPSPFQPRAGFPEAELRELAESLLAQGQVQPVLLRPGKKKGRYELVDGERRWRAAKIAGLSAVRAEVGAFTDAEVRGMILASALQRADLNAIEEARAFKAALDAGDAPGPTELARQHGLSQGHVSNRLRLLELPADVQKQVISQEIPATHARELARFKDHPKLASAIAAELLKEAGYNGMPTVEEFRRDLVHDVARCTQELAGHEWDGKTGQDVPYFRPTPEQRQRLAIVSVERPKHGRGAKMETVEFATNREAWKKMQAAHKRAWLKEHPAGKDGKKGARLTADGTSAKKKKPKKLSPAQEAARAKEQAEIFRRRLYEWRSNWLRWLCRQWIADPRLSGLEDLTWLLFYFAASQRTWNSLTDVHGRDADLTKILKARQVKVATFHGLSHDLAGALGLIEPEDLEAILRDWLGCMFWREGQPPRTVPDWDVDRLAAFLRIGTEAAWLEDQAGPLSEAYWNLHTKEQLVELAAELKVGEIKGSMPKPAMVKALLAYRPKPDDKEAGLNLPKELKKIKRPK